MNTRKNKKVKRYKKNTKKHILSKKFSKKKNQKGGNLVWMIESLASNIMNTIKGTTIESSYDSTKDQF